DTDLTTVTQGRDASITVTRPDNTSQTYTNTSSTAGTGTSSSNRFTAATTGLTGVTLFSLAEGESSFNIRERETSSGAVSNTAVQEASTSIGAIRDMITKYNELISQLKTDTAYDVNTQKGGPLSNDASIAALSAQLSTIFSAPFTEIPIATGYTYPTPDTGLTVAKPVGSALGAGEFAAHDNEGYRNYQDVGFRVERDGKITIDEVKLKAALTAKPDAVRRLFAYEDGATQAGNSAVLLNRGGTSTTWGDGIATRLRNFANQQSSSVSAFNGIGSNGQRLEGAVLSRISSIGRQNSLLNDGIKRNETRLVARERMLRIQFQAMEKAVSSLKTQGNYLQSQFNKQSG
ncbi:MAG: flagellar filament capping protein FliD, partial [Candidatus Sericytochromatia bacterium]|nr:flagellar filament capping protein FliD [Candidatus Sericytochromatia bacterium]